jgi:hypothetical protein
MAISRSFVAIGSSFSNLDRPTVRIRRSLQFTRSTCHASIHGEMKLSNRGSPGLRPKRCGPHLGGDEDLSRG